MTTSHVCSAKDPSTCRYHGALSRMEEAERKGDFNGYISAREELVRVTAESQRGLKKFFTNEQRTVPPVLPVEAFTKKTEVETVSSLPSYNGGSSLDYADDDDEYGSQMMQEREDYLRRTQAVATPMEAFALWIAVYKAQGGRVQTSSYNYNQLADVYSNNMTVANGSRPFTSETKVEYNDIAWDRWTPTQPGVPIPEGYGSASLELLILPDVVDQPLHSASTDHREGWEWGHSDVYILRRDPATGKLIAETNNRSPRSYKDVDQYLKGKTLEELTEALSGRMNNARLEGNKS